MAQLIKLQDYISRYEQDIFKYPSRYMRLKNKQWDGVADSWEHRMDSIQSPGNPGQESDEDKKPMVQKMREKFFGERNGQDPWMDKQASVPIEEEMDRMPESTGLLKAKSVDELKQLFLDSLLPFQLKWASSTLAEKSFADNGFLDDGILKYFLQRFPDTVLVMYKPVFLLKKAPVEGEVILLTPTAVWCIKLLEDEGDAVFIGSKEHFWPLKRAREETKILNPLLALERTGKIVTNVLSSFDVDMPVHQAILCRNGYIDYSLSPYGIKFIDKRNYEDWFQTMRGQRSPLKHVQLKAAQTLLQFCMTTSVRRLEWK
ncbi:NERD domain-containing protein [Mesobacillus zeae]|uniref:NERD domain-containing protein n=1 Tax=Mesobacillus zeae TaxID=1917180 RepID=A0A398B190_9BACI|nr:NERD domain-containing protein [Mesobacillus zeae]RID83084.1 NERD domain-containing protein [Mesobacillus zeae]